MEARGSSSMYSSPYKSSGTVGAFEEEYKKQEQIRRAAERGSVGCAPMPISENSGMDTQDVPTDGQLSSAIAQEKKPSQPCKPKNDNSGLLFGLDGGDILLILLMIFFLTDKDSENDKIIPLILGILLLF